GIFIIYGKQTSVATRSQMPEIVLQHQRRCSCICHRYGFSMNLVLICRWQRSTYPHVCSSPCYIYAAEAHRYLVFGRAIQVCLWPRLMSADECETMPYPSRPLVYLLIQSTAALPPPIPVTRYSTITHMPSSFSSAERVSMRCIACSGVSHR